MRHIKKKKKRWVVLKGLLAICIATFVMCCVSIAAFFLCTDKIDPETIYENLDRSSNVYSADGELISTLYYDEDRKITDISDIPDDVKCAFIAIEDKTFYTHHGFNFKRMVGAVLSKLTGKSDTISGTSTITQQLARNVFLPEIKSQRSISRKLTEMAFAYQIEQKLSKEEILEAYLNTIYLGYGCYGINSAAKTYFSKSPEELNLSEAALLATLPQAPDSYALLKNEDTGSEVADGVYANNECIDRRDLVLDLMEDQGYINEEEKEDAKLSVEDVLHPDLTKSGSDYTYFKDYLTQQIIKDLADTYAYSEEEASEMVYTGGLNIYSTIDPDAQKAILDKFSNGYFPYNYGEKETQAAMVISEVGTGKIIAMVGGRNTSGEKLFNRATSPRQPGSAIKPLSVYSAALQKSLEYQEKGQKFDFTNHRIDKQGVTGWGDYITAGSYVVDEPTTVNGKRWPLNASRTFTGRKRLRTAVQQSINTCAVKVLYQIGPEYSADILKKYGVSTLVTDDVYNDINAAALALGAMTEGVSPLEMSLAYGAFPGGGYRYKPICYTKVETADGEVLLSSSSDGTQVIDEGVAWIMTDILKSVVTNGLGYGARISGVQVGGKTGTTDQSGDLWFCGFTPKYSAALWVGADDNKTVEGNSTQISGIWGDIMDQIPGCKEGSYRDQPENVIYQNGEYYTKGTETGANKPKEKKEVERKSNDDDMWIRGWELDI